MQDAGSEKVSMRRCGSFCLGVIGAMMPTNVFAHPVESVRGMARVRFRCTTIDVGVPFARIDVPASPVVTSPVRVPGRSISALSPLIAQCVQRDQLTFLVFARLGGLYGP